jgi:uncharacterized protein (TIGR00369 family)
MDEQTRTGWPTSLADYVGWQSLPVEDGAYRARMEVRPEHRAPNGFLQASVVIALADMCCASGTFDTIPDGASFTTVELKTNLLSTTLEGGVVCTATLRHGGRTTQVWDAEVRSEATGRTMALFRCTQLVLHPRSG